MKRVLLAILIGVVITVFFLVLGLFLSGAGHSLAAMTMFFPYGVFVGTLLKDTGWDFIGVVLMALQFPLYAILVAKTKRLERIALILFVVHTVAAAVSLTVYE